MWMQKKFSEVHIHAHHCLDNRHAHINCVCAFCMFSFALPRSWICKQKIFLAMRFVYTHPHPHSVQMQRQKFRFVRKHFQHRDQKRREIFSQYDYDYVYSGWAKSVAGFCEKVQTKSTADIQVNKMKKERARERIRTWSELCAAFYKEFKYSLRFGDFSIGITSNGFLVKCCYSMNVCVCSGEENENENEMDMHACEGVFVPLRQVVDLHTHLRGGGVAIDRLTSGHE